MLVPMCPLFRGSTAHKEEDNLSIVDKMAGPNVASIGTSYISIERLSSSQKLKM